MMKRTEGLPGCQKGRRKGYCLLWFEKEGTIGVLESPLDLEQDMDGSASWFCRLLAAWLLTGYLTSSNLSLPFCKVGIFGPLCIQMSWGYLMRVWI